MKQIFLLGLLYITACFGATALHSGPQDAVQMPDALGYSSDESIDDDEMAMMATETPSPAVKMHKIVGKDPLC
jgi:hypothetical protein